MCRLHRPGPADAASGPVAPRPSTRASRSLRCFPWRSIIGCGAGWLNDMADIGPSLLSVRDLKKYYQATGLFGRSAPPVRAVDGVSFDVGRAETLALVGESGCGKSSVGRTILRLQEPTSGEALFEGVDVFSLDRHALRSLRRKMQIIFQDPYSSLNPRMSVGAAIAEGIEIHRLAARKEIPERGSALLHEVGLAPKSARRYPHEFSGGQRQRIGIARA